MFTNVFASFAAPSSQAAPLSHEFSPVTEVLTPALNILTQKGKEEIGKAPLERVTEAQKRELVAKSVLHNKQFQGQIKPGTHLISLMGQIHADALARGNVLESLPSTVGAAAWQELLCDVKEVSIPEDVQTSIKQYVETSALIHSDASLPYQEITQAIYDLKCGQSYLLEGGLRREGSDCPIVYEFIRVSEECFDLFVYLGGKDEGIVQEKLTEEGKKIWNRPIVHYQNIPAETHLFFGKGDEIKPDFFQAILETRMKNQGMEPRFASFHLLEHLQAFRQMQDPDKILTQRRAFTEAWSSLKPFLIRKLGKENYKKAVFEIRLNSLIQGYRLVQDSLAMDAADSEKLRIVLTRGAKLILKNLASFHTTNISISEKLFTEANATALDLIDKIEGMEKKIASDRRKAAIDIPLPQVNKPNLQTSYRESLENAQKDVAEPQSSQQAIHTTKARLIKLPSSEEFPDAMTEFVAAYEQKGGAANIRRAEIEHLVAQMPVPNSQSEAFWNQIASNKYMQTLAALSKMLEIYKLSALSKTGVSAHEANTAYTLFAIIHHLALAQDRIVQSGVDASNPISLAHYPIHFHGMDADKDPYLVFTSPEEYARREELVAYFKDSYVKTKNYHSKALFDFKSDISFHANRKPYSLGEYLFALTGDSRFHDELEQKALCKTDPLLYKVAISLASKEIKRALLVSKLVREINLKQNNRRENADQQNILEEKGFNHLRYLANAAKIGFIFAYDKKPFEIIGGTSLWKNPFGLPIGYRVTISSPFYNLNLRTSDSLHPGLCSDQKRIFKESFIKRNKPEETSLQEAEVLKMDASFQDEKIDPITFLRSSCEPSLFPFKLLSYFRGQFSLLESFQEQELFELALFRSAVLIPENTEDKASAKYQGTRFFPIADALEEEGFQEFAKQFIQDGIDRYFFKQPNQKPKVLAGTFFIRLACRLSRFTTKTTFIDPLDLIGKMMATPSLSDEEKSLLSIHKILAYRSLDRELSNEEVEEVFGAWVFYQNTPLQEGWRNLLLEREAEAFVHKASTLLEENRNQEFQRTLLKTALAQLGIKLPDSSQVSAQEPHIIEGQVGDKDFWTINILTGEVKSTQGILRFTRAPDQLQDATFRYIFGNIDPSYRQSQNCYYFSHPKLGTCRAIEKGYHDFKLQIWIDNHWHQYVPPEKHLNNIPRFLCGNHTHWINTDEFYGDMVILDRASGDPVAKINRAGAIKTPDNQESFWSVSSDTFLTSFERPEYIHWRMNEKGQKTLNFSRYRSQAHHALSFEQEGQSLVFSSNKKFILSKQQKPGLLGAQNGSLVLVHKETGAEKVLVPLRPLSSHTSLSTQHAIDVQDKHVNYSSLGEYYADQKGRFQFLEFDVKQGNLIPISQEGSLYLVYQYLAQRRYEEAFYWLKQIDYRDPISVESQTLLQQAIRIAGTTDTSPEAAAVALHAWVLIKKAYRRRAFEEKPFTTPPDCTAICSIYNRFEHQIPENLLLNSDDQFLCGMKTQGTKRVTTFPQITKFLPSPHQWQRAITPIKIPPPGPEILFGPADNPLIPRNLQRYEWHRLVVEAKQMVYDATPFIPLKTVPSNFYKPVSLINNWSIDFEQGFFKTAYEIARGREGSENDRHLLAFKLQTIDAVKGVEPKCWSFLQLALKYPKKAPDLPDPTDFKARLEFVNRCAALSKQNEPEPDIGLFPKSAEIDKAHEPKRPISAPILPPRSVEPISSALALCPFSKERVDNGMLMTVFGKYFEEKEKDDQSPKIDPPVAPKCTDEMENAWETICAEFKEFETDFNEGAKINQKRKFYRLDDPGQLQKELEKEVLKLNGQIADLESTILEIANKHDPNEYKKSLYKEAGFERELSLKQLADLFLKADAEAFAKANPYLKNHVLIESIAKAYGLNGNDAHLVIDYLYNMIGLYMTHCVNRTRLQRSIKLCAEIQPLNQEDLKRDSLVQKLADELTTSEEAVYSIQKNPEFLVFEYLSGLSIRPQQARLLEKLLETEGEKYINRVIQLIMGGGKTSVMAVILLKLAAKKGRLSLFVTPSSQYASVSYNLRKTLRDCFGIDMEEIEVTRELLSSSPTMCDEILTRLKDSVNAGDFLLIKSETLQAIGLQFLDFLQQAATDAICGEGLIHKINTLKKVLILLRTQGDALLDEIDLLLNVLEEVNFPIGKPEFIAPERIELIRELFLLFMNEKASVGKKEETLDEEEFVNLKELIGLKENRQNLVPTDQWKNTIAKAVAFNLSKNVAALKLRGRPDFISSFERYINGTMNLQCQELLDNPDSKDIRLVNAVDQQDYQFLVYVRQLRESGDPSEEEAAHQIALIKHMLQKVLKGTFGKKGKRNYGRGGSKPGEVRPYLAVDTPSDNLFGYHWEAVAYHFQTALQCGISKEQMLRISKVYKNQSVMELEKEVEGEKKVFDTTFAAIEFKELTGISLYELDEPGKIEEAITNLNNNIDSLLRFEAETAAEYVSYYPKRLTSTGQSLVGMLCTARAMSGTTWNTPCYPSSLANNYEPSVGTEGQIAEKLLSRAASGETKQTSTHLIHSKEISDILKELLENHPKKECVRILLDSGALFKNYSNLEVAKAIRDYLGIPVLFFMRNPLKDEKTPDTLAVLKVGFDQPEIIGGTRLEDIQKTGLNLEDYFVFDDDRHTTGTDIPLIPNAIGLLTLDETMLRRTLFQTVMRERELFLNQEVEFVIPHNLLPILQACSPNKEISNEHLKRVLDIVILSIINQANTKTNHYYRSCKQKIDYVFRQNLLEEFLTDQPLTLQYIQEHFPPYKATTVTTQADKPYDQFGALEYPVESMKSLEAYRNRKLATFPKNHARFKMIEEQTKAIIDEAKKSQYLPKTVQEGGGEELGTEVDVLTEVASEVNQEVDQEIEQELFEELEIYQKAPTGNLRRENYWKPETIKDFLTHLASGQEDLSFKNLSLLLSDNHYPYEHDYSNVFSEAIQATASWIFSTNKLLPVFHKMQRPLDQILIVKHTTGFRAIALSQYEAKQFKCYLKENQNLEVLKQVWLIQPDGSLLQDTPAGPLPLKEDSIQRILVECNVFNGRIDYLDIHEKQTTSWLHQDNKNLEIKKTFLKLKIANNSTQKGLFFRSDIFGYASLSEKKRAMRLKMKSKEIDALSEKDIQALTADDSQKLKWLPPQKLNLLRPEQVILLKKEQIPYLTNPELIKAIPEQHATSMEPSQMSGISSEQVCWFKDSVAKTQAIAPNLCKEMEDEQLKLIRPSQVAGILDTQTIQRIADLQPSLLAHISGDQVSKNLIKDSMVPHLRKKEAIEQLSLDSLHLVDKTLRQKYLTRNQVSLMTLENHKDLIDDLTDGQKKWLKVESKAGVIEDSKTVSTKETNPIQEKKQHRSITKVVLLILAAIVATGVMTAGALALIGALWSHAPQFTIVIYHALQNPLLMPCTLAGSGTLFMVGLITYAIHKCRQPSKARKIVHKADLLNP